MRYNLISKFKPTGDQPQAIKKLTDGVIKNKQNQVLLGVTGSGKTFTIANVIKNVNRPTLVISHNKTLAAQLYQELRDFFPDNSVCYFVSYYDYYQPEAYIPQTDTYIAKETEINDEIDKLRLKSTTSILTRKDTIVVASVSSIYNLGSPTWYEKAVIKIKTGDKFERRELLDKFIDLLYVRNDYDFKRGSFRVKGEVIEIFPAYEDKIIKFRLENGEIKKIEVYDALLFQKKEEKNEIFIFPAKHYITNTKSYQAIFEEIRADLAKRVEELKQNGKELEAHRLNQRVQYDLKMIKQVGYVNGIENYSRYFDGRKPGEPPFSLLDYFEKADSWLLVIDESHITIPQIRGMYNGDKARKDLLVEYGFRLPAAYDNRPLTFEEFRRKSPNTIYVSATPSDWEINLSGKGNVAEQLIRPTGIVDPKVVIKPTKNQIADLLREIKNVVKKKERALITTLTKRMAEELSSFLEEKNVKVSYLHSEINTLERQDILDKLRSGKFDVLVGINLLREGLDLPEVSLIAILDADKEGFLRSRTSLVQTMGRAARRVNSKVILYADTVTNSMQEAIDEVNRRRIFQLEYNEKHDIIPKNVKKEIRERLVGRDEKVSEDIRPLLKKDYLFPDEKKRVIKTLKQEMQNAAKMLDFETASLLRDRIRALQE